MNIIINTLGIQDSGGITVLEKLLNEILESSYQFLIISHNHHNVQKLKEKFEPYENFQFKTVQNQGILYRLYYENIFFKKIIKQHSIDLVYNFSGSAQFFSTIPQLAKVHNLLFYSKKMDHVYFEKKLYIKWLKQIFLKRIIFHSMMKQTKYIEVQSKHVQDYIADFIDISYKKFFIKSDVSFLESNFLKPKNYDFSKKICFFYIVGPHFEYLHKNFEDFVNAMLLLQSHSLDFEIVVTLKKEQLHNSSTWSQDLDNRTTFLGYVSQNEIVEYFQDNTILLSTSVIETLGLHVIEAIQNGILSIVPNEQYCKSVYGNDILTYQLFDPISLVKQIDKVNLLDTKTIQDIIQKNQNYLIENEKTKYHSVIDIFDQVLKGKNV